MMLERVQNEDQVFDFIVKDFAMNTDPNLSLLISYIQKRFIARDAGTN